MKLFTFLLGLFVILIGNVSVSGTIDPNVPDQKYVEYGSKFHSVVKLCSFDGKGLSCGSAVVIDSEWILTAAHVVENCHSWTVSIGDDKYNIEKIIIHPDYKTDVFGYHDIAIGRLSKKIELDYYPSLYEKNDEIGKVCSISGLGFTGDFNTGVKIHDGKKRAGSNIIDKTERSVLICSPSRRHEKPTELEYIICSGDSGGGLFIGNALAGINSSVMGYDGRPDSTYGDEACHTRVSMYVKWIKQEIGKDR